MSNLITSFPLPISRPEMASQVERHRTYYIRVQASYPFGLDRSAHTHIQNTLFIYLFFLLARYFRVLIFPSFISAENKNKIRGGNHTIRNNNKMKANQ